MTQHIKEWKIEERSLSQYEDGCGCVCGVSVNLKGESSDTTSTDDLNPTFCDLLSALGHICDNAGTYGAACCI